MSDYFENNKKSEWIVTNDTAKIVVDHGDHQHTLDVSQVDIHELAANPGQVLGDAHRASDHEKKD